MDSEELGIARVGVSGRVGERDGGADESEPFAWHLDSNPAVAILAIPAAAASLVAAYHVGIAIVDAFEWLMHIGVVLGANPFGWSL